jgi:N6-adenosine-specific RNA methylase IME4
MLTLPEGSFDIIYADPAWDYRGRKQFGFAGDVGVDSGGAIHHYETMKLEDLCALPVRTIAALDCLLYLWTTGPMMQDALHVIDAWGFTYATVAFVWDKIRTNPGYYTLSQAEFVLVGKHGKIPLPRGVRNALQWVYDETPETITQERTKHSKKPLRVRQRIEDMHPTQTKIELFAREHAPGWTAWGDQITGEAI